MRMIKIAALVALLAPSLAIGSAVAGPFVYSGYDVVNNQSVSLSGPGGFNEVGGSGQIILHGTGPSAGVNILAWCIDVLHWLQGSGTYTFNSSPSNNGTNPPTPAAAALSTVTIGQIGALIAYGNAHINDSYDISSGTQIAIWTTEYAGLGYSFLGSPGANATASALLALLPSLTPDHSWLALTSKDSQGLVTNQSLAIQVPEPGALGLLGAGLLGIGLLRRRGKTD